MTPTDLEGLARECAKTWKTMRTSPCSDGSCDHVTEDMAALIIATFRPAFEAKDAEIARLQRAVVDSHPGYAAAGLRYLLRAAEQRAGEAEREQERLGTLLKAIEGMEQKADTLSWEEQCEDARALALKMATERDEAQRQVKALMEGLSNLYEYVRDMESIECTPSMRARPVVNAGRLLAPSEPPVQPAPVAGWVPHEYRPCSAAHGCRLCDHCHEPSVAAAHVSPGNKQ